MDANQLSQIDWPAIGGVIWKTGVLAVAGVVGYTTGQVRVDERLSALETNKASVVDVRVLDTKVDTSFEYIKDSLKRIETELQNQRNSP